MQKECISVLKEGVVWDDVHLLAHKIAIDGLLEAGILKGDKDKLFRYLRVRGTLPSGSVVTVEPGVSDIHGAFERVLTFSDLLLQVYHRPLPRGPRAQQIH